MTLDIPGAVAATALTTFDARERHADTVLAVGDLSNGYHCFERKKLLEAIKEFCPEL